MAKSVRTVRVTTAQKNAAKALVTRSAKTGRYVSSSVAKIANAKSVAPSASGRFVSKDTSNQH